jgi:hypothetical protein
LDHPHLQTLAYLMLSVAGHLTVFLARTRGPFWSVRPAPILCLAVFGTQILATLIAVYGLFMTPLGWGYAAIVWGYALAWFLLTDLIKLLAYRLLDRPTPAPTVTKPLDLTPEVEVRAYQLYDQHGRHDGHANQDWIEAESEISEETLAKTGKTRV